MAIAEHIFKEGSIVQIKSALLNIDNISLYELNIFVSPYEFGFSIMDTNENQCLRLESMVFKEMYESGKNDQMILDIFQDNHLLPAAFWKKINVFVSNRCYTMVPNDLFTEDIAHKFLELNTSYTPQTHHLNIFDKGDYKLIYGYKKELGTLLKKIYPNRDVSIYANVINLIKDKPEESHIVYLYQDNSFLTIVAYKNYNFEFCNTFLYKNSDDALYYTLLVYKELNFNTEEVKTIISGSIDTQTILQARLYKYIKNVKLGSRPTDVKLCYNFDEIQDNRFFNLLNINTND